jgi:hypothetical protein
MSPTDADLDERDRYIVAATRTIAHGAHSAGPLARYLTATCPECDERPDPRDSEHVLSRERYVLVGCEGYLVINPALMGFDRPEWDDWTRPDIAASTLAARDQHGTSVPSGSVAATPTVLTGVQRGAILATPVDGPDHGVVARAEVAETLASLGLAEMSPDARRYVLTDAGWAEHARLTTPQGADDVRITVTWSETVTHRATLSLTELRILVSDGAYLDLDPDRDLRPDSLDLTELVGDMRGALAEELDERSQRIKIEDSTITDVEVCDDRTGAHHDEAAPATEPATPKETQA